MYIILYSSSFFGNPREKSVNSSLKTVKRIYLQIVISRELKKKQKKKHNMQSKPNVLKTVLLVMLDKKII